MEDIFDTKTCPVCGQELFDDMRVCYGCMHEFADSPGSPQALQFAALPDIEIDEPDEVLADGGAGGDGVSEAVGDPVLMLRIATDDAQTTISVPQNGIIVGRDPLCDVVLKAREVSKRHLRVIPLSSAVIIEDLGSTNPAVFKGREVRETAVIRVGESFEVCGARFTVVVKEGI